mmetsp:Transcript_73201/g.214576  ORF Transcript_73201/g.214576 Transcript_73201/m.214576 type:complete len:272 (-) Transcript_73201:253-1068(-)
MHCNASTSILGVCQSPRINRCCTWLCVPDSEMPSQPRGWGQIHVSIGDGHLAGLLHRRREQNAVVLHSPAARDQCVAGVHRTGKAHLHRAKSGGVIVRAGLQDCPSSVGHGAQAMKDGAVKAAVLDHGALGVYVQGVVVAGQAVHVSPRGRHHLLHHNIRIAARWGDILGVRRAAVLEVLCTDLKATADEPVVHAAVLPHKLRLRLHEGTGASLVHTGQAGTQLHLRTGDRDVLHAFNVALPIHAHADPLQPGTGGAAAEGPPVLSQVAIR